jgi:hypothetical protein
MIFRNDLERTWRIVMELRACMSSRTSRAQLGSRLTAMERGMMRGALLLQIRNVKIRACFLWSADLSRRSLYSQHMLREYQSCGDYIVFATHEPCSHAQRLKSRRRKTSWKRSGRVPASAETASSIELPILCRCQQLDEPRIADFTAYM